MSENVEEWEDYMKNERNASLIWLTECILCLCAELKSFYSQSVATDSLWSALIASQVGKRRSNSSVRLSGQTDCEGEWAHNFYYSQYLYDFYIHHKYKHYCVGCDVHKSRVFWREMRWPFIMFFIRSNKSVKWYVEWRNLLKNAFTEKMLIYNVG